MAYDDAQEHGRLELDQVGYTYCLFQGSHLNERPDFDLKLRFGVNLSKYEYNKALMQRMFSDSGKLTQQTVPSMSGQYWQHEIWLNYDG